MTTLATQNNVLIKSTRCFANLLLWNWSWRIETDRNYDDETDDKSVQYTLNGITAVSQIAGN